MYTYLNIVTSRMLSSSLFRNVDNLDWTERNNVNIQWTLLKIKIKIVTGHTSAILDFCFIVMLEAVS